MSQELHHSEPVCRVQTRKAKPIELAYTALARMAAATGDGDAALQASHEGLKAGVPARLRAFTPALLAYAVKGQIDRAFKVSCHACLLPHPKLLSCRTSPPVMSAKQSQH